MDYASSGVNIDAGNDAVERIKPMVQSTFTPQVLTGLGQFASFVELPSGYLEPVLVSCTDGVGTKLKLAIDSNTFDTVGIDLVAMCVNDLICCGAKPLYFLDYIAVHALDPNQIESIMTGMVNGCKQAMCSLVGGEMAEMNDMYKKGDFDLAGFSVGVVEKSRIIDGTKVSAGDTIYALPSSGVHSNGYSLVRKICTTEAMEAHGISTPDLLTPTAIYVEDVLSIIDQHSVHGIAHITGGGLVENIERILPEGVALDIDYGAIKTPDIFSKLQQAGDVADSEMWRVFNMGVGMVVITPDELPADGNAYPIGQIINA
ncbi:phosphoribosylformylglycinamidine cyclo-ligase [Candidatus Marinamargulisbacteria bacterium SCGC AG-343-K17]|nr:phosphoribosylformylglycinamidine cyclo-ligase [Candidatus Marinamargulisbacteria bacterium SCGC AG-343-K17]